MQYNPPDEILPIFNWENYNYDTGAGISQSAADLRYIKKSGDTATGIINFSSGILNSDGSNASPSISFINDSNTGIYRIGADNLGITCGGINQLNLSTTAATFTNPIQSADGTASNCGYGFSSSASSGMYYSGGILRHMLGNTEMMKFQAAQIYSSRNHNFVNGTAGNPSICAQAFQTTGFFWAAGPILGVSSAGVQKFQYTTTQNISNQVLNMSNNNIINAPQVGNTAGNLELAVNSTGVGGTISLSGGSDLLQATAGGSAGLHLKLTINGVAYKIALLNV